MYWDFPGVKTVLPLPSICVTELPDMEYFFSDTGKELPETYEYLDKLEAFLGKPIVRLNMHD